MNIPYLPKGYDNAEEVLRRYKTDSEEDFIKRGELRALQLFHLMSQRVPAYKDFLQKNAINPEQIKTIADFKNVPNLDKNNYLRVYPRDSLCWDGEFGTKNWVISATSGSTGEPFYFPRETGQDKQYALTAELYLKTNFSIDSKKTLYIVGFPMGIWIGGVFTYEALRKIVDTGKYKLTLITPGISKIEIIKAIKNLGSHFDQILIGSYAPFLKDVIDDAIEYDVDLKNFNVGFIFSAEGFSETFRDYVIKKTGIKKIFTQTLNHYGTVDLGTMSHETALAILVRRLATKNVELFQTLFGQITKMPTLTQYNPEMFYFESVQDNLYCSAFSGIPLVRYDLKDHGGVMSFADIKAKFGELSLDLNKIIDKANIADTIWKLPFVYVYERSDFSVSFFAFQIYPETIRKAIQLPEFEKYITGKFTMIVTYDINANQKFELHIELKKNKTEPLQLKKVISEEVVKVLLNENSEYRKTHEEYGDRVFPYIVFWPYEDPLHFQPGTKQKWVKKYDTKT